MRIATAPRSRALGTYVELAVTDETALEQARALLSQELTALELARSRFLPDSELSRANAAAGSTVPASRRFRDAVRVALRVAADTEGLVDPTLGVALVQLGYDRDFADLDQDAPGLGSPASLHTAAPPVWPSWADVRVDDTAGTVRVPSGCGLDLGATAKAHGADLAASLIAEKLGVGVLVSLGGDVAMQGASPPGGWPVRVRTTTVADDAASDGETVMLAGGGLATSSPGARQWTHAGQRQHHILDPQTRRPAPSACSSVTVAAGSCVDANAASTAAVVLGVAALRWLSGTGYPCRLVAADGSVHRIGGWPEPGKWSR